MPKSERQQDGYDEGLVGIDFPRAIWKVDKKEKSI
jgi:hypothetical protein